MACQAVAPAVETREQALMQRIAALEALVRTQQIPSAPVTPVAAIAAPSPATDTASSRLEQMLEKTLACVSSLAENQTKNANQTSCPTAAPADSSRANVPAKAVSHDDVPPPLESDEEESEDDDDNKFITTPDGKTVAWWNIGSICCMYLSYFVSPCSAFSISFTSQVPITPGALRMRCRRLCEKKRSGKYNIDAETAESYKNGGQERETLELALLECIAKHGTSRESYKRIRVWFGQIPKVVLYIKFI